MLQGLDFNNIIINIVVNINFEAPYKKKDGAKSSGLTIKSYKINVLLNFILHRCSF